MWKPCDRQTNRRQQESRREGQRGKQNLHHQKPQRITVEKSTWMSKRFIRARIPSTGICLFPLVIESPFVHLTDNLHEVIFLIMMTQRKLQSTLNLPVKLKTGCAHGNRQETFNNCEWKPPWIINIKCKRDECLSEFERLSFFDCVHSVCNL